MSILDDASCGCTSQTAGGRAAWPPAKRSKALNAEAAAGRVQRLLSRSCQSVARLSAWLWQHRGCRLTPREVRHPRVHAVPRPPVAAAA